MSDAAFQILLSLAGGERHGYGIMREISERTAGKFRLGPGTLYAAIKRLLREGLILLAPLVGIAAPESAKG